MRTDVRLLLRDALRAIESDEPSEVQDIKARIAAVLSPQRPKVSAESRLAAMCDESEAWHKSQGLRFSSADETLCELLPERDIAQTRLDRLESQVAWLRDFLRRWEHAESDSRKERDSEVWFSVPYTVQELGPDWNALQLPSGFYIGQFNTEGTESECEPQGPFETEAEAIHEANECNKELRKEDDSYVSGKIGE